MLHAMRSHIRHPKSAQPASLTPRQVATAYNFPLKATGKGYVGGIIELGGGYTLAQVNAYFASQGLPAPIFVPVTVGQGQNKEDGPNGADGEVQLDMLVAGSIASGASFRVYFAGNTDADFLTAIRLALHECDGVSLSWGGPETDWSGPMMDQFEAVIKEARGRGVPLFVASGDSGSQDGTGANTVDYPASSPSAIGCGGTRLSLSPTGQRASEVVWDDSDLQSATGGGVSKHFPGRDVPDIAGNADPDTGYRVSIDGQAGVIGGTSAVAPLMLGLHALLWELNGGKLFDFLNLIVTNPQACFDVTSGDNGGFRAGPGRDQTTGFGVPDGAKLLAALTGGVAPPAPPGTPTPTPTDPLATFPVKEVKDWLAHKHTYNASEAVAAAVIVSWGESVGLPI